MLQSDTNQNFAREVAALRNIDRIDHVIVNAGILQYPNVGPIVSIPMLQFMC